MNFRWKRKKVILETYDELVLKLVRSAVSKAPENWQTVEAIIIVLPGEPLATEGRMWVNVNNERLRVPGPGDVMDDVEALLKLMTTNGSQPWKRLDIHVERPTADTAPTFSVKFLNDVDNVPDN